MNLLEYLEYPTPEQIVALRHVMDRCRNNGDDPDAWDDDNKESAVLCAIFMASPPRSLPDHIRDQARRLLRAFYVGDWPRAPYLRIQKLERLQARYQIERMLDRVDPAAQLLARAQTETAIERMVDQLLEAKGRRTK